ncbi:hypothetical protein [Paenibacillus hamazuiensis]|uniref:hypothetical protein n=1 Tax=Paenibacillus hamazuiensis TaxID=2936508 RepID=UPI00200DF24F|nr:hypothetical protein [Paenibacillus hamazuiensis]
MKRRVALLLAFFVALLYTVIPDSASADTSNQGTITSLSTNYFVSTTNVGDVAYYTFRPQFSGKFKVSRQHLSGQSIASGSNVSICKEANFSNCIGATNVVSGNPTYPNAISLELEAGTTYYLLFQGFASTPASANIKVDMEYRYINLFVKAALQTSKQINGKRARLYSDGRKFVNIQSSNPDTTGLTSGVQYISDTYGIWYSESYLTSDAATMISTSDSDSITLTVQDSTLIARADNPPPPIGVARSTASAAVSACSPNCDYTFYLMAGVGTVKNAMWPDAISKINTVYGSNVQVYELFPYDSVDGLSGLKLIAFIALQTKNVAEDSLSITTAQRILDEVNFIKSNTGGGKRIIIGHSGGGVAGARTARYLEANEQVKVNFLAMVGSPRTSLSGINSKVIAIAAPNDPVPDSTYFSWPNSIKPAQDKSINLAPQSNGFQTHATYFVNISWNNGQNNNVTDTINMVHSFAN